MKDRKTTYNITDDEGDSFKIEYLHIPCKCCPMGCSPDKLIIYDYPEFGGEEECTITLEGDCKSFMLNLLGSDYKVEKINE